MTDASGVPTNPDNIPTFNTSNDAPSGLGFNTAMAQIQAIITNLKAGTLASGKILASALTGLIPTANLGSGAASGSTFLRGDQTWASPGSVLLWDSTDSAVVFPAASVTTPALPQTFKHLRVEVMVRSATVDDFVVVRFNGDTGANYDSEATKVAGTVLTGIEAVGGTGARCSTATASTAPAGEAGIGSFVIPNYADATKRKTLVGQSFYKLADTTTNFNLFTHGAGWRNTAAITTLTFLLFGGQNLIAPCRISVYGEG